MHKPLVKAHVYIFEAIMILLKQTISLCEHVQYNDVVSVDHKGMLRTDCSGETRLALHVPSSS